MFLDKPFSWAKRRLSLWEIEPSVYDNARIILVPHAGISYSGTCATSGYLSLPKNKVKHIIMLCTAHSKDSNLENEHSYYIHKAFIDYYFNSAEIIAKYLIYNNRDLLSGINLKQIVENTLSELTKSENTVVIANVDLIHYGPHYNLTDFVSPEQKIKEQIENGLINALQNNNVTELFKHINNRQLTTCGPGVLKVVGFINDALNLKGKVLCYHDSTNVTDNILETLHIHSKSPQFVSYLSMVFAPDIDPLEINKFDEFYLLSRARSLIMNEVTNPADLPLVTYNLPEWSPWNTQKNGTFVGIKVAFTNNMRASIGNYESPEKNIVENVLNSAQGCLDDAIRRWGGKITIDELPKLTYYIQVLQHTDEWLNFTYEELKHKVESEPEFMPPCKYGIHMETLSGNSATYLPSVWCERPDWTFVKLMNELLDKSGGNTLRASKIRLYTTHIIEQDIFHNLCFKLEELDKKETKYLIDRITLLGFDIKNSNDVDTVCQMLSAYMKE